MIYIYIYREREKKTNMLRESQGEIEREMRNTSYVSFNTLYVTYYLCIQGVQTECDTYLNVVCLHGTTYIYIYIYLYMSYVPARKKKTECVYMGGISTHTATYGASQNQNSQVI